MPCRGAVPEKEKLCRLNRRAITPLAMHFTFRFFYPQNVFPRKPTEESPQVDKPREGEKLGRGRDHG